MTQIYRPSEVSNQGNIFSALISDRVHEANTESNRLFWDSEATIELPPLNGKACRAIPVNLKQVILEFSSCNSPKVLKKLREQYSIELMKYVCQNYVDTANKKCIEEWMSSSTPTKKPLPYTLIRVPDGGEKWFQIEIQPNRSDYLLVSDPDYLVDALKPLLASKVLGIDTETTGLDPHSDKVRLLQIAAPEHPVVIIDLFAIHPDDRERLRIFMQGSAIKVFHNAKFDLQFLDKAELKPSPPYFDTMLASQLLQAGLLAGHSLKAVAAKYLDVAVDKEQQISDWSLPKLDPEQLAYAAKDAAILLQLREKLRPLLLEAKLGQVAKLEFEVLPAVADMELNGMLLDIQAWDTLGQQMKQSKAQAQFELGQQLRSGNPQLSLLPEYDIVDPDSYTQILVALKSMGIPVPSTGKDALIPLAEKYPVVKTVLNYRKFAKTVSAFTDKLPTHINPITHRIHASYNQYGAATGRFSVNNPNLQQIPRSKDVRSCFIPAPGYKLVIADYSQIELRVAAEISRDKTMIAAYQKGEDLHKLTASLITGKPLPDITKEERQAGKPVNFGLIYGCGARKLGQVAENDYGVIKPLEQWEAYRKQYFKAYKGIAAWHTHLINEKPMEIRTLLGRRRQWDLEPWVTATSNSIVQGTAADITKVAIARLPEALLGTGAKLIGTVHDEILLEVPEECAEDAARILRETMESAGRQYLKLVPVEAEAGVVDNWSEK